MDLGSGNRVVASLSFSFTSFLLLTRLVFAPSLIAIVCELLTGPFESVETDVLVE